MTTPEETDPILKALKQFSDLENSVASYGAMTKNACEVMNRQTKMLDLALDAMVAIVDDDTVEFRIRRRLTFALAQIKGIGFPS